MGKGVKRVGQREIKERERENRGVEASHEHMEREEEGNGERGRKKEQREHERSKRTKEREDIFMSRIIFMLSRWTDCLAFREGLGPIPQ